MWDGHCHTELCRHGKQESTIQMIEQALDLGFTKLSLTEHAPLPLGVVSEKLMPEFTLMADEMEEYLSFAQDMKNYFSPKIEILIGLEVDYLHAHEDYTIELLDQYGPRLDDSILSLHFMPGSQDYSMIDYSPEVMEDSLIEPYGGGENLIEAYWKFFTKMILSDLGPHKPKRLGHAGIIYKFAKLFEFGNLAEPGVSFFQDMAKLLQNGNYSLDDNYAGVIYKHCGRPYLPQGLRSLAEQLQIPLIYGSDAHGISAVQTSYQAYEDHRQHD